MDWTAKGKTNKTQLKVITTLILEHFVTESKRVGNDKRDGCAAVGNGWSEKETDAERASLIVNTGLAQRPNVPCTMCIP